MSKKTKCQDAKNLTYSMDKIDLLWQKYWDKYPEKSSIYNGDAVSTYMEVLKKNTGRLDIWSK